MTTLEPVVLADRHVRLEPLAPAHAAGLLAAARSQRATFTFTHVPSDLPAMEAYIAKAQAEHAAGKSLPFAVLDPAGHLVGSTRFMDVETWSWPVGDPPAPLPTGPDVVEIGSTWYAERVQRTALNTAAKLLLCTHAFETWRVRRVRWKTDARNERSRAAILRLGARFDGVLRAARPAWDGGVRDDAFYSMLAVDWPAARDRLAARLQT